MCLCKTNIIQYNLIFVTQISIVFGLQKIQNHSGGTAYYLYSSACFSMNIFVKFIAVWYFRCTSFPADFDFNCNDFK